jgi:hypothetical protein
LSVIWDIFPLFGMFGPRNIWQPWCYWCEIFGERKHSTPNPTSTPEMSTSNPGLPDIYWYNIPKIKTSFHKVNQIVLTDIRIFHSKAFWNLSKFGFWYENIRSGSPGLKLIHVKSAVSSSKQNGANKNGAQNDVTDIDVKKSTSTKKIDTQKNQFKLTNKKIK